MIYLKNINNLDLLITLNLFKFQMRENLKQCGKWTEQISEKFRTLKQGFLIYY